MKQKIIKEAYPTRQDQNGQNTSGLKKFPMGKRNQRINH